MKINLKSRKFLILGLGLWLVIGMQEVRAETKGPIIPLEYLKGKDTVMYLNTFGLNSELLNMRRKDFNVSHLRTAIDETLRNVFKEEEWIKVKSKYGLPYEELKQKNIVTLVITVSARKRQLSDRNEPIKLGSVYVELEDSSYDHLIQIPNLGTSVPFIIPDDDQALIKEIQKAVRMLTAHLPGYMKCASRVGELPCHSIIDPYQEEKEP